MLVKCFQIYKNYFEHYYIQLYLESKDTIFETRKYVYV